MVLFFLSPLFGSLNHLARSLFNRANSSAFTPELRQDGDVDNDVEALGKKLKIKT
jgi:hypothetical protein